MKSHLHHRWLAAMPGSAVKAASLLLTIVGTSLAALPTIANASEPWGTWVRPSTGTQVNFYECDGKLCAKIVAVKEQSRAGEIGTLIMTGAAKSGTANGVATF